MVSVAAIVALLNTRKKRVLCFAAASLPESQFKAFRGLFLDEFGRELERDLERVLAEHGERKREGQADTSKKGGAP